MTLPISVVMPVVPSHVRYLDRAIEGISSAGADEFLIFIDSPDEVVFQDVSLIIHPFSFYSRYQSFPPRSGVCYGRNIAIHHAHHDLILPLDADDRLYPDALQRLYDAWQPGTWVYGNYVEIDENENIISDVRVAPPPGMLKQKNLTFSTFLFHRDDWRKAGGYDPDFEFADEDYAFQCALTHNGVRPVRLDGAPLYQRMIHASGRTEKARRFWTFAQTICKERWPGVFA